MTNITDSACYYSPVIIKDMPRYAVLTGQETILKTFEYEKRFKVWSRAKGTFEAQICIQFFSGFYWEHSSLALTFERPNLQNISAIRGKKDINGVSVEAVQLQNKKHVYQRHVAKI